MSPTFFHYQHNLKTMADSKKTTSEYRNRFKGKNDGEQALMRAQIQPQAVPLEEAILGAIMLDKDAISVVLDILHVESFYTERHQVIYEAVRQLFESGAPIDLLTVTEQLKKSGNIDKIGGYYYLVELSQKVVSSANLEYHARIVAQKFIQRELIRASTSIIREAYEDTTDVFDLLDKTEKELFAITQNNMRKGVESIGSLTSQFIKQLEELDKKEDGLTGVPTGFTDLDRLTSGWQPSDLIVVAARPGMGKTAFTLSMARNAALDFQKPVAIFSLEMSNLQLVQRLVAMEAEISSSKFRNANLDSNEWIQLDKAIEKMSKAPIFIDDTPAINIFEIRAKCRRLKMKEDIQLIIIDYLQLMSGGTDSGRGNREQEISTISRSLKGLAKELNVPVIALSQLSRAVEMRGGAKRPQLSDLRESGAIEQDADIVSFIYRPEYYQILQDEEGNSLKDVAEIIVAKHRNGALDTVRLRFIDRFAKFGDLDDPDFESFIPGLDDSFDPTATTITRPSRMNMEEDQDIPF